MMIADYVCQGIVIGAFVMWLLCGVIGARMSESVAIICCIAWCTCVFLSICLPG
jgi:hypothetical protein